MDPDERIWRLAEGYVRVEQLKIDAQALADQVRLSLYDGGRGPAERG